MKAAADDGSVVLPQGGVEEGLLPEGRGEGEERGEGRQGGEDGPVSMPEDHGIVSLITFLIKILNVCVN